MSIKDLLQTLLNTRATKQDAKDAGSFKDGTSPISGLAETGIAPEDGFIIVSGDFNSNGGINIALPNVKDPNGSNLRLIGGTFGIYGSCRYYVPVAKGQTYEGCFYSQKTKSITFIPRALT